MQIAHSTVPPRDCCLALLPQSTSGRKADVKKQVNKGNPFSLRIISPSAPHDWGTLQLPPHEGWVYYTFVNHLHTGFSYGTAELRVGSWRNVKDGLSVGFVFLQPFASGGLDTRTLEAKAGSDWSATDVAELEAMARKHQAQLVWK